MTKLVVVYIVLYLLYIVLGHRFIRNILYKKENKEYSRTIGDIMIRAVYFCYITLLYNAYYFYKPSYEVYVNCILMNVLSIIVYAYKYGKKQNDGLWLHIFMFLPVLYYRPKTRSTKLGVFTLLTIGLIFFYTKICNNVLDIVKDDVVANSYEDLKSYCAL